MNIYVLELEHGKYYVGKTKNLDSRIRQHFNGNGSWWTKYNKPIKVIKTYTNTEKFDEEKITYQYMDLYGIDNVRGGSFCNIKLTNDQKSVLDKILKNERGECFECGKEFNYNHICEKIVPGASPEVVIPLPYFSRIMNYIRMWF